MAMINWSIDSLDWESRDADAVYKKIIKLARNRGIILCHDLYGSTAEAMERVIPKLMSEGYQLVTISELMHYSGANVKPGELYFNG
jgi:peptidoglycan/xylan/chitin deacetylase (PgdA/CDA1 family)